MRSTPVHAILGNFLHLDDGDFVASGAFVSTRRTLEETQRLLEEDAASPEALPRASSSPSPAG